MEKRLLLLLCMTTFVFLTVHTSAMQTPSPPIDRNPPAATFLGSACSSNRIMTSLPRYDPNGGFWQLDLRNCDLSQLDLHDRLDDLLQADFDTRTVWPPADRMPPGFDAASILDLGKNPGLGVRSLHARGIIGQGVSIAIIDQPLLIEQQEYGARLQVYEEIHVNPTESAAMHGPAVASIAVGKTLGWHRGQSYTTSLRGRGIRDQAGPGTGTTRTMHKLCDVLCRLMNSYRSIKRFESSPSPLNGDRSTLGMPR
jgi:hypothetical protein